MTPKLAILALAACCGAMLMVGAMAIVVLGEVWLSLAALAVAYAVCSAASAIWDDFYLSMAKAFRRCALDEIRGERAKELRP